MHFMYFRSHLIQQIQKLRLREVGQLSESHPNQDLSFLEGRAGGERLGQGLGQKPGGRGKKGSPQLRRKYRDLGPGWVGVGLLDLMSEPGDILLSEP